MSNAICKLAKTNGTTSNLSKVYLAGKIQKNDWRHGLFPAIGVDGLEPDGTPMLMGGDLVRGSFECCGPFFQDCDHGCFHGSGEHGLGAVTGGCGSGNSEIQIDRDRVVQLCLGWIDMADVVFCYLDGPDPYGTLFELGYAAGKGKPIFVAFEALQDRIDEFDWLNMWKHAWFLRHKANMVVGAPDVMAAWSSFNKWYFNRPKSRTV